MAFIFYIPKSKLSLLHYREDLRHEDCHECDDDEECDLASRIEEYRCDSESSGKDIYDIANICLSESELEKTVVKVVGLISSHRVGPCEHPHSYHIDEVDEIDTDHRHRCRDLPTCDDSECRDEECEDDRP